MEGKKSRSATTTTQELLWPTRPLAVKRASKTRARVQSRLFTRLSIAVIVIGIIIGIVCISIYIFAQSSDPARQKIDLDAVAAAQTAAKLESVPQDLSDQVFTLCQSSYNLVFLADGTSGLFECQNTHEVYSVFNPANADAKIIRSNATYLGQTANSTINNLFPASYYLYRELDQANLPDELAILLPATSPEDLIDHYLEPIRQLLLTHDRLKLRIFYTDSLDDVQSIRDYILISATGAFSLISWLPNGDETAGYANGTQVTYSYAPDVILNALQTLGLSPTLYPDSVRHAITITPHFAYEQATPLSSQTPLDILRTQLLEYFVTPSPE